MRYSAKRVRSLKKMYERVRKLMWNLCLLHIDICRDRRLIGVVFLAGDMQIGVGKPVFLSHANYKLVKPSRKETRRLSIIAIRAMREIQKLLNVCDCRVRIYTRDCIIEKVEKENSSAGELVVYDLASKGYIRCVLFQLWNGRVYKRALFNTKFKRRCSRNVLLALSLI